MEKYEELMKLNIQLFAEDNEADNEPENNEGDGSDAATEDDTTPVDKTKAFSDRLNAKTKEIEQNYQNKLNAVAKQQGFDSWEELEQASDSQAMKDLGVEDEEKFQKLINKAVDKNPDVVKAREIVRKNEEDMRKRELEDQISKIGQIDSSIKTMDDIAQLDNVQDMIDCMKRGYSLYDAYRLVNFDTIVANSNNAAKNNAIKDINSKSHMKTSTGGTGKSTYVPRDVYDMYKRNMPNWTDEQIREHYAKSMEE